MEGFILIYTHGTIDTKYTLALNLQVYYNMLLLLFVLRQTRRYNDVVVYTGACTCALQKSLYETF